MQIEETSEIFIGRDQELEILNSAFDKSKKGKLSSVAISAKSGFGKSKLINEFLKNYANYDEYFITFGQGKSQKAARPFEMLLDFFANVRKKLAVDKILTKYVSSKLSEEDLWILCSIYSGFNEIFISQRNYKREVLEEFGAIKCINTLSKFISIISHKSNHLILILDDCQWADELTLSLLGNLTQISNSIKANYILLICSYRSDEINDSHKIQSLEFTQKIELAPLNSTEVSSLIRKLNENLPESAKKFVLNAARGNPFFVTSAVRSLIESGVLENESNDNFDKIFNDTADSYGFLKKRFEYITFKTLEFLKWAAISGKVFDITFYTEAHGIHLSKIIKEAKTKYFIEEIDINKFIFVHDKIREVLLTIISKKEQKELHESLAEQLISHGKSNIYDIAFHLNECGLHDKALGYALKAAEEGRKCFALEVAEFNYKIAEKGLITTTPQIQLKILEGLGDVLMLRAKYPDAKKYYQEAMKIVIDDFSAARIERSLGELLFKMGKNYEAAKSLERALNYLGESIPKNSFSFIFALSKVIFIQLLHNIFPSIFINYYKCKPNETTCLITQIYNRLAIVYWFSNGIFKTLWSHLSALNKIERFENSYELAHTYSSHGPAMSLLGLYKRSSKYCFKSLKVLNNLPENKLIKGQCLHFNGVAHYCTSQFRKSMNFCIEAVTTLEDVGDYWEMNIASSNVALALYRTGSLNKAISYSQKEYNRTLAMGDLQSATVFLLVETLASEGNVDISLFDNFLKNKSSNSQSILEAQCGKARILIRQKKYRDAFNILYKARTYLYRSASIQEYSFIVLPWLVTSIRLLFTNGEIQTEAEKRKILSIWKRILFETRVGSFFRSNNEPHILRELSEYYLFIGKINKAEKIANKCLKISNSRKLIHEEFLTLESLKKIHNKKYDYDHLKLHSKLLQKREECFKF